MGCFEKRGISSGTTKREFLSGTRIPYNKVQFSSTFFDHLFYTQIEGTSFGDLHNWGKVLSGSSLFLFLVAV